MAYPFITPSTDFSDGALRPLARTITSNIQDNYSVVNNATMMVSHGMQISAVQNFVNSEYLGRETIPVISGFITNLKTSSISISNLTYDVELTASGLCFNRIAAPNNTLCYTHNGIIDTDNIGNYNISIYRSQTNFSNTRLNITSLNEINMTAGTTMKLQNDSGLTIKTGGTTNISGAGSMNIVTGSAPIYINTIATGTGAGIFIDGGQAPITLESTDAPVYLKTGQAPIVTTGLGIQTDGYLYISNGDTKVEDIIIKSGFNITPEVDRISDIGSVTNNFDNVYCKSVGDMSTGNTTKSFISFSDTGTGNDNYLTQIYALGASSNTHGLTFDCDGELNLKSNIINIGSVSSTVTIPGNLVAEISASDSGEFNTLLVNQSGIFEDIIVNDKAQFGSNTSNINIQNNNINLEDSNNPNKNTVINIDSVSYSQSGTSGTITYTNSMRMEYDEIVGKYVGINNSPYSYNGYGFILTSDKLQYGTWSSGSSFTSDVDYSSTSISYFSTNENIIKSYNSNLKLISGTNDVIIQSEQANIDIISEKTTINTILGSGILLNTESNYNTSDLVNGNIIINSSGTVTAEGTRLWFESSDRTNIFASTGVYVDGRDAINLYSSHGNISFQTGNDPLNTIEMISLPTTSVGLPANSLYIYNDGTRKYICIV